MGTNFYVRTPPSCGGLCAEHCHGEEIHLGKSSAGWAFSFRAYPEPDPLYSHEAVTWPVTDFASWLRLLDLGSIYDEYATLVAREDLLARIEAKRGGINTSYPELRDFLDDAGNRFIPREFS